MERRDLIILVAAILYAAARANHPMTEFAPEHWFGAAEKFVDAGLGLGKREEITSTAEIVRTLVRVVEELQKQIAVLVRTIPSSK